MLKHISRSVWLNLILIIISIAYCALNEYTPDEIVNLLWILIVLLFIMIPRYFYKRHYLFSIIGYIILLMLGIINMEMIIEGDGELEELLQLWTWTHELPHLLWPTLFVIFAKIATDLWMKQELMIQTEKERSQSELKYLKSQLSPHVLFNNLNNIYSFALHKSKKTPELILKLADSMRYLLYETREERVPLTKELAQLDDYIDLQKLQFENIGEIIYEKKGSSKDLEIAPMMLIGFVENCFKHAASNDKDPRIIIQVEVEDNTLHLYTENSRSITDKKDEEQQLQAGGIGLDNVKRRLSLIYPGKHTLIVKELEKLFIVNLSIDLV